MKPLTTHQRTALVRRLAREILFAQSQKWERDNAELLAGRLIDGLSWTGVHGASEKRAVELIVTKLTDEATA